MTSLAEACICTAQTPTEESMSDPEQYMVPWCLPRALVIGAAMLLTSLGELRTNAYTLAPEVQTSSQ